MSADKETRTEVRASRGSESETVFVSIETPHGRGSFFLTRSEADALATKLTRETDWLKKTDACA